MFGVEWLAVNYVSHGPVYIYDGTVRGVYNHKSGHIDRAESAHGVSWCAEIGRPTYAFASLHRPFRSLFADFRRFSSLNFHIDYFSLKFTQNESNFKMLLLIKFESNKNSNQ